VIADLDISSATSCVQCAGR